jgi:signal transduction histidine kinase
MFKSLRLRLTIFFVLAAGVVYVALALAGVYVLQQGLDGSLDHDLVSIANQVAYLVDMSNLEEELAHFRRAKSGRGFMPTIQFFDKKHKPLGYSGPLKDVPFFYVKKGDHIIDTFVDSDHVRVLTRSVSEKSKAGWIQVIVPLSQRDMAIRSYYDMCAMLSPLLLFGLAVSGYLFASHATRPVEQSFLILKNFMADAGHELNTPIAIMQANVETLAEDPQTADTTLPIILRTCERMGTLVGDLLLLSRLESPEKQSKTRVAIDLKTMADSIFEEFIRLYEAKGITLSCTAQEGLIVNGDHDAIHRAISNLLKNALTYTDAGSVLLQVSKSRNAGWAEISVTDTGKGIPPESLSRIFDRFYRVDKHRARSAGGSGLGLAIVRVIVESHGGSINVKSTQGSGSTFTIELPLTA